MNPSYLLLTATSMPCTDISLYLFQHCEVSKLKYCHYSTVIISLYLTPKGMEIVFECIVKLSGIENARGHCLLLDE